MPHNAMPAQRKSKKPLRQKHIPVRTCVSCRESGAKRGLTRIVRSPEGEISVDLTGKKNGRGAYLCGKPECWRAAVTTAVLSRALKVQLSPSSIERLNEFAVTLPDTSGVEATAATTKEMA